MNDDEDLLPLSGVRHVTLCERQFALVHVESLWAENQFTVLGKQLHERQDELGADARGDLVVARALPLSSHRLGLSGRADAVEFHRLDASDEEGAVLPNRDGRYRPYPVETKRGRPKLHDADRIQLCAQAICLEEMLGVPVPKGALFYGQPRRREEVVFNARLRAATEAAAERIHELVLRRETPPAVRKKECDSCSLIDLCLPKLTGRSARAFLARAIASEGESLE